MIQAIGLTGGSREGGRPAVDDLSFEAPAGRITVLLGAEGAGKTTALRLMLQLEGGRGVALFRGRPLHRVPNPAREIGVVLGDVPGHPARTARGHLRMLTAAAGVPASRADDVLDVVGLSGLADEKLGAFSRGMDRRLGLATALLGDPHTLLLDEPSRDVSPREAAWLHGLLQGYAAQGGAVLVTSSDARAAARLGHRVVTIEEGRLAADQSAADFARTRLRPRVVVRSPHADRLASLLVDESQRARPGADPNAGCAVEVVRESGSRIAVYGSTCAAVGDTAFRHGILVHRLADEVGDTGPITPLTRADGRARIAARAERSSPDLGTTPSDATVVPVFSEPATATPHAAVALSGGLGGTSVIPPAADPDATAPPPHLVNPAPPLDSTQSPVQTPTDLPTPTPPTHASTFKPLNIQGPHKPLKPLRTSLSPGAPGPAPASPEVAARQLVSLRLAGRGPEWPLRYELRRATTDPAGLVVAVLSLAVALVFALVLARAGDTSRVHVLTGWPRQLPFPPAALAAGLIGALSFGQEFRYPALAPEQGTVPRRLGLLAAKLLISGAAAALLAVGTLLLDGALVRGLFGSAGLPQGGDWKVLAVSWTALMIGCAWAGVLAAGVFRSTAMGLAAVLAVPVLVLPLVQQALETPAGRSLVGVPARLRSAALVQWPSGFDQAVGTVLRLAAQPVSGALTLSLTALVFAYALTALRKRAR
ncbi:ABC transporter [Streptomyces sp. WAC 06783]|uniref:ATP-binding cassette domain-containing protein n=1 Tax=Streptomyces sp. WAC 06783 TaxID=2203211 RepID=UPI000F739F37|nr:ATP-binding cassette domain-containing protein [Streptomyces sp. WAC 06783]RSO04085.1 ABC transporter [Streptomyces sp. WAC 06783]